MPLLSFPVPSLVGGVSQQAPAVRLTSELEAQENAYSSIVEGLGKRSPSKHIARLGTSDVSDAFIHTINRSASERYKVIVTDGDLKVFGIDGTAKTVAFPDGKEYLNTTTPRSQMRAVTVADYTFIVNSGIEAAMSGDTSDSNLGKALVSVKQGQYGTTYIIKIDGVEATSYTTSATVLADIQTDVIAEGLIDNLGDNTSTVVTTADFYQNYPFLGTYVLTQTNAFTNYVWHAGDTITITGGTGAVPGTYAILAKVNNSAIRLDSDISGTASNLTSHDITSSAADFTDNYTFTRVGSSIYIEKNSGTAIDISVEDTYGNQAMKVATDKVQRFTDLPVVAPAGFVTKVVGDTAQAADDYYVEFVPLEANQTFSNGNWVETIGPTVETTLDTTTMPHVLVRESDGTFTFREGEWSGREVGDTESCPDPSFIGNTIQDIFFFRDRLGVLTQENVVTTVQGDFFNFFRESVATALDTDPIDLASTQTQVATLKHALPFHEELLLFADQAQLVFTADGLLTPTTAVINQTTDYQSSLDARPVGAGDNVYFAFPRGAFSGLREYFVQANGSNTKGASDVTGHVPKYISGTITKLAACTSEDVVIAITDDLEHGFYIYKYYWINDQKVQSSWSKYLFEEGCQVLSADFIESTLYFVVQRDDGYHLESMEFQAGQTDEDSRFVIGLDRRLDETQVTVSYDATSDMTTWTLPYEITSTMRVVVRAGDDDYYEGMSIQTVDQTGTMILAEGDYSSTKVFIGQPYEAMLEFSKPVLRQPGPNGGETPIIDGKYQIRNLTVGFDSTAYFEAHVILPGRDTMVKPFNSVSLGVAAAGEAYLAAGKHRVLCPGDSQVVVVRLISDSHLPCRFTTATWEGFFTQRSQRA